MLYVSYGTHHKAFSFIQIKAFNFYKNIYTAFNWFTGKESRDTLDIDEEMVGMQTVGPTPASTENDTHLNGATHSSIHSSRKNSVYVKSSVKPAKGQRLVKTKKTFSERIGMKRKTKPGDSDNFDSLYDISRCPSEDFDAVIGAPGVSERAWKDHGKHHQNGRAGGVYESDGMCLMERHIVPVDVVQTGMSRFSFLLETSAPGTLPDPLLIAALLDLVNTYVIIISK